MGSHARSARLCVTNAKGGTGKTTIAINVAGALNERGRDVLLVDLDPQGNATEGLGLTEAYDAPPPTLFDALLSPDRTDLADVVVEHEEMDLVPSSVDMLQAERELTVATLAAGVRDAADVDVAPEDVAALGAAVSPAAIEQPHGLDVLDRALAPIEDAYDYVVIDAPPFYGQLTDVGIYTARNVLVPALTEATSERAIELLLDQITALERQTGIDVSEVGVVANRVEATNEDREMIEWFETAFPTIPVWRVRKRVALQRSFSSGTSVFAYDSDVDVTDVFEEIAADLDAYFGYEDVTDWPAGWESARKRAQPTENTQHD